MIYLSQMLGQPVIDSAGKKLGKISDLAISTGEVFPHITSLAFTGPERTPFMLSWRKYVDTFTEEGITLKTGADGVRFSYLQPNEILLARDLLNKQIVDTQGMKLVRVNDIKLSVSGCQLRLLGAEVGMRGILRGLAPWIEQAVVKTSRIFGRRIEENIIAWNYIDLVDRDLSKVNLAVSHKRLDELHPADIADILEQLDPAQRSHVFNYLDKSNASEAISEMEDEYQTEFISDLSEDRAADILGDMDPDDAAEIVRDLPYEKAEVLLHLMGMEDARDIRRLLGYKDGTAGGMMTTQYVSVQNNITVAETVEVLRALDEDHPTVHYVYVHDEYSKLVGVLSLRTLVLGKANTEIGDIDFSDLIYVAPDVPEDEVIEDIFKYDIPAMPVVDENGVMLGIVTVEDAWDALEEDGVTDKKRLTKLQIVGLCAACVVFLALYSVGLLRLVHGWL